MHDVDENEVVQLNPVSWENLPGSVKAAAMNDPDKYRGRTWFRAVGTASYFAYSPSGRLVGQLDAVRFGGNPTRE